MTQEGVLDTPYRQRVIINEHRTRWASTPNAPVPSVMAIWESCSPNGSTRSIPGAPETWLSPGVGHLFWGFPPHAPLTLAFHGEALDNGPNVTEASGLKPITCGSLFAQIKITDCYGEDPW